jgi:toluene monooxygenase system protein E
MTQQKTYWHLLSQRRMPTEYEIATSKLLLNTGEGHTGRRFELNVPLEDWYQRYQQNSQLTCSTWEKFSDPRRTTYSKYTGIQMEKEIFVDGVLQEIDATGYDRKLSPQWLQTFERLAAPFRYPGHAFMMLAAYVGQMAPSGKIVVAAAFQAGDEARRVERIAYRIRQIQIVLPGFASNSRSLWERDSHWQPLREFVERLLIVYDWGESFAALNLVLKPMIDELFMKHLSDLALSQEDHLLGQILYSLNEDCQWHREWSRDLTRVSIEEDPQNRDVIRIWVDKWRPLATEAVSALAGLFAETDSATGMTAPANLQSRVIATSNEYLGTLQL